MKATLRYRSSLAQARSFTALLAALLLVLLLGLCIGSTMISPLEVIAHLLGKESDNAFTIDTLRLPRLLLSVLVGAALGVSGLIMQAVIRNPLGSPDILGVTGGASLGAVFFITSLAGTISLKWLPLAAIIGAAAVSILIYLLAWRGGVTSIRLVLVGIGMAAAMGALTTMVIVFSDEHSTVQAYIWMVGSVYGANWVDVRAMLPWAVVILPLAMLFARTANVQELGDELATGLGVRVQLSRLILLAISVALAGSAVAYAGAIGFVGLIAPHIARRLVGRKFTRLIPATAIIGGIIVAAADTIARTAFLPHDLPAGVFVSGIGAPFFMYLLYRNRHQ
ncbi:iron ABC transporter permease [Paenibacillus sp. J5C_2022]|uniref:FecCD family ABC transporter permease n=1 Tax=Paenibacillus sp. J5C2022 TaxID=2977129 RepID=UPI0021CF278D|nr:iron ABC transporter permease [Paenibacillus sp. J5C2022]MCU6710702.1 iron ABC transporter permease [Paenibacillus sp. J5C2022]